MSLLLMGIASRFRVLLFLLVGTGSLFFLTACDSGGGGGDDSPPTNVDALTYTAGRSDLQAFATAVNQTDLAGTLEGDGPFTVLVPQSEFMPALNVAGLADSDGLNDVGLLQDALSYHVIQGQELTASQLSGTVSSLEGADLSFEGSGSSLTVNGVSIVTNGTGGVSGGIEVTNGVVHIINDVLLDFANTAEYIKASSSTSTLATAVLEEGSLETTLEGDEFTVFAPVNSAFSTVDTEDLLEDAELLTEVLSYHAVSGSIAAEDITDGQTVATVEGGELDFAVSDGGVSVNGIPVATADIETTNGTIHLIGSPLLETVSITERLRLESSTDDLASALDDAGLATPLDGDGPFTVFAPSNAAIESMDVNGDGTVSGDELEGDLRSRVLNYHVIEETIPAAGSGLDGEVDRETRDDFDVTLEVDDDTLRAVNGVPVARSATASDGNGVIHFIDTPLLESTTILQRARLTPGLTSLVTSVEAAGSPLSDDLGEESESLTVFAPVNAAFGALDLDELSEDPELATSVIGYHVIQGAALEVSNIEDGQSSPTVEGGTVELRSLADSTVTVNGFEVTTADILARNGVVHLIGDVLLSQTNITQRATLDPSLSSLQAALEKTGLDENLGNEGATFTTFAPTNDAFGDFLGDTALEDVPDEDLEPVLLYHVLSQEVASDDIRDEQSVETLQGSDLTFRVDTLAVESIIINPESDSASIDAPDVGAKNGVVHIIDTVLSPPAEE